MNPDMLSWSKGWNTTSVRASWRTFSEGRFVRIKSTKDTANWDDHKKSHIGQVGIVRQVGGLSYNYDYMVEFGNGINTCRHLFNEEHLEAAAYADYVQSRDNKIAKGNDNMIIKNAKQYVKVNFVGRYADQTAYDFATDISGLAKGDLVVVDTQYGFGVAKIVDIVPTSEKATKWIVQKVDLTEHQARLARAEELGKIKAEMAKRRAELEEIQIFRLLAANDPNIAAMLAKYEELTK